MVTWRVGLGPCSWRRAPCPLERDFCACAFGGAPPRGRKSRLGESWIFACSCRHFHLRGVCQCQGGTVFIVQSAAFSSSRLSLATWLIRHPVSGTCGYPRGCDICWFAWYPRSPPETFPFPCSCHAQGLGNCPAVGIWLAQADGGLLRGGLISPCPTIALTSTQVLPTDDANCRVPIWGAPFTVDVRKPKLNRPNTMNLVEKRA